MTRPEIGNCPLAAGTRRRDSWRLRLAACVDDEGTPDGEVANHLAECHTCRDEVRALAAQRESVRHGPWSQPGVALSRDSPVVQRILDGEATRPIGPGAAPRGFPLIALGGFALLIAVMAGPELLRRSDGPAVSRALRTTPPTDPHGDSPAFRPAPPPVHQSLLVMDDAGRGRVVYVGPDPAREEE